MAKPTTKKDFEIFKKEFLKWTNIYGLAGWKIDFEHGDPQDEEGVYEDRDNACINIHSITGRLATVRLSLEVDELKDIRQYAFHEASELLMARLCFLAESRFCQQTDIDEERHNLIRILEKVLFK